MRQLILIVLALVITMISAYKIVSDKDIEEAKQWVTYDNVGRYLAQQPLTKADDINWLPNSNKIAFGYNPIRGDPVCYTGDCHMSGYGRSLFQLEYTNPPTGSCTSQLIPKHVELDCIPAAEIREKSQKISNVNELKESTASGMSWGFGVDVPLTPNPILNLVMKASFKYGQSEQTTKMMNHIYRDASIVYHTYARVSTVKLSLFAPKLELSDNFRYVIDNLPTSTYTPGVAKRSFALGGIAQMTTVINQTSIQPIEQEYQSTTQMIGLSFAKVFSFNYNENESENSIKLQGFQKYVKSSTATTVGGATFAASQKLNEWFQTVPKNPVIIKFTLQPIFDLITSERFGNDSQIDLKADYIKRTLEDYLNQTSLVYCENKCTDPNQGVCRPLDAYGYGLCKCFNGYDGFDCSTKLSTSTIPPQ
ncbi:unnamed protein product [Adineta steineri]|uniref:EGF-like domain-containing protein n=1 Tax=Adineta steineri TaxID=433720 RepID=A0A815BFC3_9BILA|nr:unnamed protein product [Adineta steineri]CAF4113929.1 unnamed protein product [Adineta steineri]